MENKFHGVYAALITPFDEKGRVAEKKLRKLVRFLIEKGLHGLYICGSTGEGINMNIDERKLVAEVVKDEVKSRIKIICHVGGSTNTKNAVELAKHAEKLKLDALSAVPPFYYGYSFDDIFNYYKAIGDASKLPIIIYYIPTATGAAISNEKFCKLSAIKTIAGLKYTGSNFFQLQDLLNKMEGKWIAFSGADELSLPALTMGVVGSIGSTQNVIPEVFLDIYNSFKRRDFDRAMQLQKRVTHAVSILIRYNGIVSWKAALKFRGIDAGLCKMPFKQKLDRDEEKQLKTAWKKYFPEYSEAI